MDRLLGLLKIFAKEYGNWNKWSSWKCHENSLRPRSTPRSYIAGQGCNFKANLILKWKNDVSADRRLKRLPRPWSLNPQPTTICNLQDSPEQRTTATRACPPRGMSSRSAEDPIWWTKLLQSWILSRPWQCYRKKPTLHHLAPSEVAKLVVDRSSLVWTIWRIWTSGACIDFSSSANMQLRLLGLDWPLTGAMSNQYCSLRRVGRPCPNILMVSGTPRPKTLTLHLLRFTLTLVRKDVVRWCLMYCVKLSLLIKPHATVANLTEFVASTCSSWFPFPNLK